MKIKKVEFSNINSLVGNWCIDFESPDFKDSSMFCISGPTGSGKTSILDAICLGLYGVTPRQGKINSSCNEVMSYGTLSCSSKVTFESKGITYTATWSQGKGKKGNLKAYAWSLVDQSTGSEKNYSNQSDIENEITKLIGLNFEQFTKSMMLAQGEFNKFLTSSETKRAAILEKLMGDEIYRQIAIAVHDLYAKADDAVNQVKDKIGEREPLSDEERKKMDESILDSEKQKKTLEVSIERLKKICTWYTTFHDLEKNQQNALEAKANAENEKLEFASKAKKLEIASNAHDIEPDFAKLKTIRENMGMAKKQLESNESAIPAILEKLKTATETKLSKIAAMEAAKTAYEKDEKIWDNVSAQDAKIASLRESVKMAENAYKQNTNNVKKIQYDYSNASNEIARNETSLKDVEAYMTANAKDAEIEASISLLEAMNNDLKAECRNLANAQKNFDSATVVLKNFDDSLAQKKRSFEKVNTYLDSNSADAELPNILPQAKSLAADAQKNWTEVSSLQKLMESKTLVIEDAKAQITVQSETLQSLKTQKEELVQHDLPVVVLELRDNLKAGSECPVCGSTEHPACNGLNHAISNGVDSLNGLAEGLRSLNEKIQSAQAELHRLDTSMAKYNEDLVELTHKLDNEKSLATENLAKLNKLIEPWNVTASIDNVKEILDNLEQKKNNFLNQKSAAENLGNDLKNAEIDRAEKANAVSNVRDCLENSNANIKKISAVFVEKLSPWFSNIDEASIDALIAELKIKNNNWKTNQTNRQDIVTSLESLRSQKKELENRLNDTQKSLGDSQSTLIEQQQKLSNLEEERKILFGEKSVEKERNKARGLIAVAESEFQAATTDENKINEEKVSYESKIAELKKSLETQQPELDSLAKTFMAKLASKNFASENDFIAALIPESDRKNLEGQRNGIEHRLTAAAAALENIQKMLFEHQQKRDFEEAENLAQISHDENKQKLDSLNGEFAQLLARQKGDDDIRQKCADLQKQLEQLQEKRSRWAQMQAWFNGKVTNKNGDTFARFVQNITLKNLLKTANAHLRDMFPRYELTCNSDGLDIMLIDHDNSDAIRPISNISGGEGFLVSLSLALGISTLASRNVSIDSMFLDEGFGTLDTKILQETIVVLQKMQREKGKMLGVITHVDLVKDELKTHIDVVPRGGGRSILKGAGLTGSGV